MNTFKDLKDDVNKRFNEDHENINKQFSEIIKTKHESGI